ncbi:uncharacterized protein BJX67DRAFT_378760 [Aspergillus lucknowensis]|uniref:Cadherin domain-containing protein n=1 Tax=Aspergillus lucknowensis TaxID=176173 RepID=A0ABR4LYT8_9EURO
MLRRIFSAVFALSLGSATVSAELFDLYSQPPLSALSKPYTLNLSCAECAFSYSDCSESVHPLSYLTITFSTKNDTLLANDDMILPTPIPMVFQATRHWDSSSENVPVAYALDEQPVPHQPDTDPNNLYHLKLTLVDLQGRPATESPVSITIVRSPNGTLQLTEVEESIPHIYHHDPPLVSDEKAAGGWWRIRTWGSYFTAQLHRKASQTKTCDSILDVKAAETADVDVNVHVVAHRCRAQHQSLADWAGDRHYLKLVRPVLLPALLGLAAGIAACVTGFLTGKLVVAAYYSYRERTTRSISSSDPERELEGTRHSEKEMLMERYRDRDPNPVYPS